MDVNKNSESGGNLTKRHFAKFHERIQTKYAQMQRKIEKSKSMESISSSGEDFVSERRSSDMSENKEEDKEVMNEKNPVTYNVIVEDVSKQEVVYQDCEKVLHYESDFTPAIQEDDDNGMFFKNELNSSLDNIFETSSESKGNEDIESFMLPHRATIREKISAIRERKKEQREKKKESKRKQSDSNDKPDKFILSNKPGLDASKKKNKVASVTVALIEATGPENETALDKKARQLYCRIRLGQEKYKTMIAKTNGNRASWQELFNLSLFEDNLLEITMWEKEKETFFGRTTVDLSELKLHETHNMNLRLEEGKVPVQILILITVSGTVLDNAVDSYDCEIQKKLKEMEKNFSRLMLNDDFAEVGSLSLIVYEAKGLSANDCYAAFLLDNDRVQTQTEMKTYDPRWMKTYSFAVKDITSILYVEIYDEKKIHIIGKVAIPLLNIINGQKKWYALKDELLKERAKGNNPRILLEMYFYYNVTKSSIRVIHPKEKMLLETEPDFNRHLLARNISRARAIIDWVTGAFKVVKTLFEWESNLFNLTTLTAWLIFWWYFKAWMLPLLFLVPFYWYRPIEYHFTKWEPPILWRPLRRSQPRSNIDTISINSVQQEALKVSLRQKLSNVQDMVTVVQNAIGTFSGLGESVKNLFNFTVPFLSFIAIFWIIVISIVIYFIPCRVILMFWGVHKFLRKILRPNRIPNSEILDLLSRVPDDETLNNCKELPLLEITSSKQR